MSARPLSAFSARRHASSTRITSASTLRSCASWSAPAAARSASYACLVAHRRPGVDGAA